MAESREMLAIREIAHALLVADRPSDVQQFALDRVTPLLGASFSMVMMRSDDGELLRPVAQHEWPAKHRSWIGALRVRVGDGPSGLAVAERRLVEIPDLFADPLLEAWYEVASELGFRSILAAPLSTADGVSGAVAFYFADATQLTDAQRALVQVVAEQLATASDKARGVDALRRSNAALAEANAELDAQTDARRVADQAYDDMVALVLAELRRLTGASAGGDAAARLLAVHALAAAAQELHQIQRHALPLTLEELDPREPLRDAVARWRTRAPMVPVHVEEPTVVLPTVRTDRRWMGRLLELVIGVGVIGATRPSGSVRAGLRQEGGFLTLDLRWPAASAGEQELGATEQLSRDALRIIQDAPHSVLPDPYQALRGGASALDLPLGRALARLLGGELQLEMVNAPSEASGAEIACRIIFPIDVDRPDPSR